MSNQSTETAQCIATTDRHARCKGKARPGTEFCGRHTAPPRRCDGSGCCMATLHVHGCFNDRDGSACDDPEDHDMVVPPGASR